MFQIGSYIFLSLRSEQHKEKYVGKKRNKIDKLNLDRPEWYPISKPQIIPKLNWGVFSGGGETGSMYVQS